MQDIAKIYRERSSAKQHLFFFDCGQTNPKVGAEFQGLLEINSSDFPSGLLCTAAPPEESLPAGTRSTLLDSLIRHIATNDQSTSQLMKNIQTEVTKESKGKQSSGTRTLLQILQRLNSSLKTNVSFQWKNFRLQIL